MGTFENNSTSLTRRQFVAAAAASTLVASGIAESKTTLSAERQGNYLPLTLSWGLWWQNWAPDASFQNLMPLLTKHQPIIDEVYLFDTPHTVWHATPDQYAQYIDLMAHRFQSLHRSGVRRLGAFALTTIGHDGICLDAPKLSVPPMIGCDGTGAKAVACPSRAEFHRYVAAKYRLLASVVPDFIVVADDLRLAQHRPVMWGCFCTECLRVFGGEVGQTYRREDLLQALNEPNGQTMRQAWVEHNARVLESVYATIGQAVHSVNPELQIGTETLTIEFSSYSGSAYERWFTALQGTRAKSDLAFLWDTSTGPGMGGDRMELTRKAWDTARQTELYPARVRDRRYELETYPDGVLVKDPRTYVNEIAVALVSAGCNGADIQALGSGPAHDEYLPLLKHIGEARRYLESISQHAAGLPSAGLWSAWSPQVLAKRKVQPGESWLPEAPWPSPLAYDPNLPLLLADLGLPLSMRQADYGTVLSGRVAETLETSDLRAILSGGVLMDAVSLRILSNRGLADLTGVGIGDVYTEDCAARMTSDRLNGVHSDSLISLLPSFPEPFVNSTLAANTPDVRWLMWLEDNAGQTRKGPCMSAFENSAGGRVVVSAFSPWWFLNSASRRHQMLEIADWISHGKAPVRVEEPLPITPYVRLNTEKTRGVILLLNTGLSPIEVATVSIRAPHNTPLRLVSVGNSTEMKLFSDTSGWGARILNIPPWSTVSLLLG